VLQARTAGAGGYATYNVNPTITWEGRDRRERPQAVEAWERAKRRTERA
jgi:hypothetical protein